MSDPEPAEATLSPGYSSATRAPAWVPYTAYVPEGWIATKDRGGLVFLWLDGRYIEVPGRAVGKPFHPSGDAIKVTRLLTPEEDSAARLGGLDAAYAVFLETERGRDA